MEMMMMRFATLLAGAIVLAGCQQTPPPAPLAPPVVDINNLLLAPGFLAHATSANLFEIQSSQLALQASGNPAVRNYANLLISDHTRLGQAVGAAAQAGGVVPPPPALLPEQQAALAQLQAAGSGPGFDMAYREAQILAHQQAIGLMQNYASSGDVPSLRTAAQQAIPMMQMHLQQAQMLSVAPPPPPPPPPMPLPGERGERG
jgi:putative membrane protein